MVFLFCYLIQTLIIFRKILYCWSKGRKSWSSGRTAKHHWKKAAQAAFMATFRPVLAPELGVRVRVGVKVIGVGLGFRVRGWVRSTPVPCIPLYRKTLETVVNKTEPWKAYPKALCYRTLRQGPIVNQGYCKGGEGCPHGNAVKWGRF